MLKLGNVIWINILPAQAQGMSVFPLDQGKAFDQPKPLQGLRRRRLLQFGRRVLLGQGPETRRRHRSRLPERGGGGRGATVAKNCQIPTHFRLRYGGRAQGMHSIHDLVHSSTCEDESLPCRLLTNCCPADCWPPTRFWPSTRRGTWPAARTGSCSTNTRE